MSQYKKRYKTKTNPVNITIYIIVLAIVLLSIGYSSKTANLEVASIQAHIMSDAVVRITGLRYMGADNGGRATNSEFSAEYIYSDINLPNEDSSVTYQVSVTNFGNVEMGLRNINLPSNLDFTTDGYTMEATLCDSNNNSKCTLNSVTTFLLTIFYKENGYESNNTRYNISAEFDFYEMIYTARIGSEYYQTIQAAINAAPTNLTETTIVLLKNTYERIKICAGNNIIFDMQNLVLHNRAFNPGSVGDPVVEIFGAQNCQGQSVQPIGATLTMINGTILTEADQSAINVEASGHFIMEGGTIISTGKRQALYIKDGGTAEIRGNSYLRAQAIIDSSKNNYRATAQCVNGHLIVTGGTIESVGGDGIAFTNESTTTIGTKDGSVSTTNPIIRGKTTGMYILDGSTVNFYDGIIEGQTEDIYNGQEIDDVETNYEVVHSGEIVNNISYYKAFLGTGVTVTFDASPGTVDEASRVVGVGSVIGPLPVPTRDGYEFLGWYDTNDVLVTSTTTINGGMALHAEWRQNYVAQIGNNQYPTLSAAIQAAPSDTATTIVLLKDTSEKITINNNKNIILDLSTYTLSNPDNGVIITNKGRLTLVGGTITTLMEHIYRTILKH